VEPSSKGPTLLAARRRAAAGCFAPRRCLRAGDHLPS
jgi:hypothetical protein